jgi:hypothetical protein
LKRWEAAGDNFRAAGLSHPASSSALIQKEGTTRISLLLHCVFMIHTDARPIALSPDLFLAAFGMCFDHSSLVGLDHRLKRDSALVTVQAI